MGLVGRLRTMPLPDLLQWVGPAAKTGVLTFERHKIRRQVVLQDGHVIGCSSSDPREMLGHFLVSRGKIEEKTLTEALAFQEANGGALGQILVQLGAVAEEDLTRQLSAQAEEILFGLFDWEDASFSFDDEVQVEEHVAFPVDLRIEDVLLRGMQRMDEMERIREVIHDPGIVLEYTDQVPPPQIFKNPMTRGIYQSINGERTVAELLLEAHASEYLVTKLLFELHRTGLVEIKEIREIHEPVAAPERVAAAAVVDEGPIEMARATIVVTSSPIETTTLSAPSPAPTSLEAQLERSNELMRKGDPAAALEILNSAYAEHAGDEMLGKLVAEAEVAFRDKAYRHYLPASQVVHLTATPEQLAAEANLSPEEFFLISRIDGSWDVKSIIQISPIREVDALRTLKRMRERGFIELREPD